MPVIAIVNRKGGVGKSSTTAHLLSEFLALGISARALDCDIEERSLSSWGESAEGILKDFVCVVSDLRPAAFVEAIEEASESAPVVLIDCPPGNADAALAALAVSDLAVIPCGPSPLESRSAEHTLELIREVQKTTGGKPEPYFLPNRIENNNLSRELPSKLSAMGAPVLPEIKKATVIQNAVVAGLTLWEFAPSSEIRKQYEALAIELAKIMGV